VDPSKVSCNFSEKRREGKGKSSSTKKMRPHLRERHKCREEYNKIELGIEVGRFFTNYRTKYSAPRKEWGKGHGRGIGELRGVAISTQ